MKQRYYPLIQSAAEDVRMAVRQAYDYIFQLEAQFANYSSKVSASKVTVEAIAVIEDSHVNRNLYPAENYPLGSMYLETDRYGVIYTNLVVNAARTWVYLSGEMRATWASRPLDLAANDIGFLFAPTDRLETHYRHDGASLKYIEGVQRGNLAGLPTLNADDTGYLYDVADYDHLLRWEGAAWNWGDHDRSGRIESFLVDPDPTTGWALCNGGATDKLNYDGSVSAVTLPDLTSTAAKAGYLKFGATASATVNAAVAPSLTMNSYTPAGSVSAPAFTGSAVNSDLVSGGTPAGTVAWPAGVPVFSGGALANHSHNLPFGYKAGGQFYVNTASSISSSLGCDVYLTTTANSQTQDYTMISTANSGGTPAGSVAWPAGVPTFSGTALSTHQHSVTAAGTNSAPTFTGTPATLTGTVSATGEPRNIVLRPWFRR